jgi:hypothetical protein
MVMSGKDIEGPLWCDDKEGKDRGAGGCIEGRIEREERCAECADGRLAQTIEGKGRSAREGPLPTYE